MRITIVIPNQLNKADKRMQDKRQSLKTAEAGAKRQRIGSWQSILDQQALPINPVESIALKVHSMVIRNEVTSR
jgi:hypothetical protein